MILLEKSKKAILEAVRILKSGGVIAFPTDTVYGLGCDASNDLAVQKLYELKKRVQSKPIAIFLPDLEKAKNIVKFDRKSLIIASKFFPGALTLILSKKEDESKELKISSFLNQNNSQIGIRIPAHDFSLKLLENFGGVLAVTSANLSNAAVAVNSAQIKQYFFDKIDLIIDGGSCQGEISTVVRIANDEVEIVRQGAISQDEILNIFK